MMQMHMHGVMDPFLAKKYFSISPVVTGFTRHSKLVIMIVMLEHPPSETEL